MADVLAIVVTWNAMPWARKCLGSLEKSSPRPDVLVVDNGSTDGTVDFIRSEFPKVRIVESPGNIGFGAANNIGFRLAIDGGYDFVYLLNQDAWVEKDTIMKLKNAFSNKDYGILSPVQNDAKGRYDKAFRRKCGKYLKRAEGVSASAGLVVEVPFVMAAHWMLSRRTLKTVGGFSPAFSQYGEDDNYIDRLHYFGLKCGIVPTSSAVHDRSDRKTSREKRMRLKCISRVVRLSNPSGPFFLRRMVVAPALLGMSVKNLSVIPFRFISEIRRRYPELKRLRSESRRKGAFL